MKRGGISRYMLDVTVGREVRPTETVDESEYLMTFYLK
jgi:hypothetical protein